MLRPYRRMVKTEGLRESWRGFHRPAKQLSQLRYRQLLTHEFLLSLHCPRQLCSDFWHFSLHLFESLPVPQLFAHLTMSSPQRRLHSKFFSRHLLMHSWWPTGAGWPPWPQRKKKPDASTNIEAAALSMRIPTFIDRVLPYNLSS